MKIVILESKAVNPGDLSWDMIRQFGDVAIYDRTPVEEAAARIGDAEVILINKTPITGQLMDACPNLKLICVEATGYNVVDCEAAKARGILVCNVPAYSTDCVAQFTFALLLEVCHHVGHHSQTVREGRWSACADFCYWDYAPQSLCGKTLGLVGYGQIGRAVAALGQAFGMEVIGCSKNQRPGFVGEYVDFDTLLARSDVLSLHCPATEETRGLINRDTIAKMKDGAILINTARGTLVVEEELAQALNDRKLYAAGLDVSAREPISPASPLLKARSCYITPHIAWASLEARQRLLNITVDNLRAFLAGAPRNRVN